MTILSPPQHPTIAFLGIGLMGRPMAANLLAAGFPLHAWNRTRKKAEELAPHELLTVFDSPKEAIKNADLVITMLENGDIVEAVLFDDQSYLQRKQDCLFIDMSSIPPEQAKRHCHLLTEAGHGYLDAPVSGGPLGAAQAALSIMAGGSESDFNRALPVFEALGKPVHIGPVGTGQLAKLANQAIVGVTIGAVAEALLLVTQGGADPIAVKKALSAGFAGSRVLDVHGQRMIDRDFIPGATSRVQLKDLNNVLGMAAQHQLSLPLTRQACDQYRKLIDQGGENFDHSALLLQLEQHNELGGDKQNKLPT